LQTQNTGLKAASQFSFARHEDDPTDVVINPTPHYAKGILEGGAVGSAVGIGTGILLRKHNAGFRGTLGMAGAGGLVGLGAGAMKGHNDVDNKRKAVEQAYGATDPFALQKMSSATERTGQMYNQRLDAAYAAGYQFAMAKIAAETAVVPAEASSPTATEPSFQDKVESFALNHPYATRYALGIPASLVGGPFAAAGAMYGAAPVLHYTARSHYADREKAQGRSGELPFVVKHPYLTSLGTSTLALPTGPFAPVVGEAAAAMLHHNYKKDLNL
jgi:hypothetical protein